MSSNLTIKEEIIAKALNDNNFKQELITNPIEQIIQKIWEDTELKEQLLLNPKKSLKGNFGIDVPDLIELEVVEETYNKLYFVIPTNPKTTEKNSKVSTPMWL
jgi:hypothetical protein